MEQISPTEKQNNKKVSSPSPSSISSGSSKNLLQISDCQLDESQQPNLLEVKEDVDMFKLIHHTSVLCKKIIYLVSCTILYYTFFTFVFNNSFTYIQMFLHKTLENTEISLLKSSRTYYIVLSTQ